MLSSKCTVIRSLLLTTLAIVPGAWGQTFTVLHSFGASGDGQWPEGGQVFDGQGNLYGVTQIGPSGNGCLGNTGCGTVYQLKPNSDGTWTETVIHAFNGTDAAFPSSSPVFDSQGSLYGTTDGHGGAGQHPDVVYQLTPGSNGTWTESILHQFPGSPDSLPGELAFDAASNLYGITRAGGLNDDGTAYSLIRSSGWMARLLLNFGPYPGDGGLGPIGTITFDANGNLYGTALQGGAYQHGVVFKLTNPGGIFWQETVLYAFTGGSDGTSPVGVTFGPDGSLYGVTQGGGILSNIHCALGCGTVYKLTPNSDGTWTKTTLYEFRGGPGDGAIPVDRLIFDRAGDIYSTTDGGGENNHGTTFKLTPSSGGQWTESVLHFFTGGLDGYGPIGTLAIDGAGNIYGTAYQGGVNGQGVAYEIVP